jgi:hypothetical protein
MIGGGRTGWGGMACAAIMTAERVASEYRIEAESVGIQLGTDGTSQKGQPADLKKILEMHPEKHKTKMKLQMKNMNQV